MDRKERVNVPLSAAERVAVEVLSFHTRRKHATLMRTLLIKLGESVYGRAAWAEMMRMRDMEALRRRLTADWPDELGRVLWDNWRIVWPESPDRILALIDEDAED